MELPPLEQRTVPRRSRQRLLRELLIPASEAPKGTPPEPAGSKSTGSIDSGLPDQPVTVSDQEGRIQGEQQGYSGEEYVHINVQEDDTVDHLLGGSAVLQDEHNTGVPSVVNTGKPDEMCRNIR